MNNAYSGWSIHARDFPKTGSEEDKITFLLKYAVLSPSSHNAQPWKYFLNKNKVTFSPDFSRSVPVADKDSRFLYIGIGCTYKNFEVAAKSFNFKVAKRFILDKFTKIEATISPNTSQTKVSTSQLESITNRLTNRNPYTSKEISVSTIKEFTKIANKYSLKMVLITDPKKQGEIIKLTEKGDYMVWTDPAFQDEHLRWIRHNLTTKHDGMPAFTVGIPLFASFFARPVIKKFPFVKLQAKKNKRLLESTPYFVFLLSEKHDPQTWIEVGEALEEIWLKATHLGISLAPLAQIIEVGDLYKETARILGTRLRPQLFFRLGYAIKPARHSPRRFVDEVLNK